MMKYGGPPPRMDDPVVESQGEEQPDDTALPEEQLEPSEDTPPAEDPGPAEEPAPPRVNPPIRSAHPPISMFTRNINHTGPTEGLSSGLTR